jgi:branched-chain amino acid transport system ATP-binding protein
MLELLDVSAGYRTANVLEHLSLALIPSESINVIGRNGVGKTTLLATIMGHTALHAGAIRFQSADISRLPVYRRARQGIAYVPQKREIFPSLTVRENLYMAERPGKWNEAMVTHLFAPLRTRLNQPGGRLPGGEQQMLAVARALMANPSMNPVKDSHRLLSRPLSRGSRSCWSSTTRASPSISPSAPI